METLTEPTIDKSKAGILLIHQSHLKRYPSNKQMFKVNNTNRKRCKIWSELTLLTPERCRIFKVAGLKAIYCNVMLRNAT